MVATCSRILRLSFLALAAADFTPIFTVSGFRYQI
jgi:hypothetical protein